MGNRILVTGPTRSGKSEWAEQLALQEGSPVIYVATAQAIPTDREWQTRIETHRQRRPANWQTWEVPEHLADAIATSPPAHCLLVDSLGTWLANCLEEEDTLWHNRVQTLLTTLATTSNQVILVAEETGWGVVPAYPLGRVFRDRLGQLTREIGAIADHTYLVVAGFAVDLTQVGTPVSPTKA